LFSAIRIVLNEIPKAFEIGVDRRSYDCLAKILSNRPFDSLPSARYRYFHVPSSRIDPESGSFFTQVRIEQGSNAKQCEVEATKDLISNLIWFFELKDFGEAKHLKEL